MTAPKVLPVASGAPAANEQMPEELAYRIFHGATALLVAAVSVAMIIIVINQLMNLGFFVNKTLLETQYHYILVAAFLPLAFLCYPLHGAAITGNVPWYDWLFALAAAVIVGIFAWTVLQNLREGWEYAAPPYARWLAVALWLLILEALRRTGGGIIAGICFVISLYPVFADVLPGPIRGTSRGFLDTMAFHAFSVESAFGIPLKAFGEIVVGFIVFGTALNYTGGGKFFNDVAFSLVGRYRGGAAQVGILSSMLQGSISGSVISNVVSSGVVTIPAMKRTGFSAAYAGGVEAVASTGAVLMPPVMGSTAFVMASFLGMSYGQIALAATIPALLFYFALAIQVDAYSARNKLAGVVGDEVAPLRQVMREGWPYIFVFGVLIYLMMEGTAEAMAPFWATGVLLLINQFLPTRMNWTKAMDFIIATGRGLAELVAILAGVGLIIGAFNMTGLAGTLANDLVFMAGGTPLILLVMGAFTSFLFGMGMTVTACYIFLAIILAPALIKQGMDPLAVHLFIMYWGMVSFITPPVALANFAAASIARVSPFAIGWQAMKLGSAIYIVPFLFVYNPELLLKGTTFAIVSTTISSFIAVFFVASGLQGYVMGGGRTDGISGALGRCLLIAGGIGCGLAGIPQIGLSHGVMAGIGVAAGMLGIWIVRASNGRNRPASVATA